MNSTVTAQPSVSRSSGDPVIRQVVRGRLIAITDQMRQALQAVSGSPTVTEASDFFTGLYLPDGSFATMGHQVTFEAPPVGALIRHLIDSGRTLKDGDKIVGNDPFVGALHQNDLQMCAPLFVDGELVAWAGVMAHETDIGGMDFASWSPKAKEIWQEGLRIPAVTLVSGGELREDVLEMILQASRLPDQLGLDIRAFIATLNVAGERLTQLCHRYGTDVVRSVMTTMIDDSEASLRRRLRELPDGVTHTRDFLEHDGHANRLYSVDLVLTKKADSLTFDFSGSSPQAMGFVNCSRAGLVGGVAGALIPTLGFGIPWNEGLLRPTEVIAPDGLICTAVPPAPVGSATVETIWVVSNVVCAALNRLLSATPQYAERAQAVSNGTMATFNLGGLNQYGERFGLHLMDPMAGGLGAYATRDGVNAGGPLNTPSPSIPDVEANEQVTPLVYLYRRLARDSGGAGRHRGGLTAEIGLSLSVDSAEALVMTHGAEVPNSTGLGGGLPGSRVRQSLAPGVRTSDGVGAELTALLLEGDPHTDTRFEDLGPKPGSFTLRSTDVFAVRWQGGGGLGDPLDRDPADVASDVHRDAVSLEAARAVYGVVLHGGDGDSAPEPAEAATKALRHALRAARLNRAPETVAEVTAPLDPAHPPTTLSDGESWLPLTDRLCAIRAVDATWRVATADGAVLSTGNTRWRDGAHRFVIELPDRERSTLHEDLTVTGWACPVSGSLLAVDVHRADAEPIHDLELDLSDGGPAHLVLN
ncbi:hydantoinase B/oxoprolinase family protein [Streptomyces mirabilis]|uniref:hydantoinase B/oxoprolinase family protein n=1 Tax=Streptomyces mirabilis TaxID=68239 RepID=UPI0036764E56